MMRKHGRARRPRATLTELARPLMSRLRRPSPVERRGTRRRASADRVATAEELDPVMRDSEGHLQILL